MSQFTKLEIEIESVSYTYSPYDRGANGAFVFRQDGVTVNAPRVVVSTATNDTSSDKYVVQINEPRTCPGENPCGPEQLLGTDLVKTEFRFLGTTSPDVRALQIDKHIALLQELRGMIEDREVMYS